MRDEILLRNVSDRRSFPHVVEKQIREISSAELSTILDAIADEPFRNISFVDICSG